MINYDQWWTTDEDNGSVMVTGTSDDARGSEWTDV
jgi:hypothetical protein